MKAMTKTMVAFAMACCLTSAGAATIVHKTHSGEDIRVEAVLVRMNLSPTEVVVEVFDLSFENAYGISDDKQCVIYIDRKYVKGMSNDTLAFVLGHEIGHCAMKDSEFFSKDINDPSKDSEFFSKDIYASSKDSEFFSKYIYDPSGTAEFCQRCQSEYDADKYGFDLANVAGYDGLQGASDLMKDYPYDSNHASGAQRIEALVTGKRGGQRAVLTMPTLTNKFFSIQTISYQ
jgi:hypothetical protein